MRAQPKGSHYINGQFIDDASGPVLESIYPATGEVKAFRSGYSNAPCPPDRTTSTA